MLSEGSVVSIVIYVASTGISMAITIGTVLWKMGKTTGSVVNRIEQLEKRVEKYNNFSDRVSKCEASTASAHHRIDELRDTR
jgi:hypothetical protein